MYERNGATIGNIAEILWQTFPAHYDAHSKALVVPENTASRRLDFRISAYQPKGYVEPHKHAVQEQVYYVLEGEGLIELDNERRIVRAHDYIFIPPGVEHAIFNTGLRDLIFFVITTPPTDA